MWWIIGIIAVVILIVVNINKDHKQEVKSNVSSLGGMQVKYKVLIEYLTHSPSSKIAKLTKDHITVTSPAVTVWIDYVAGITEIRLKGMMPPIGQVSNKWRFQQGYPQEKMIEEIENFIEWKMKQV